MFHSIVAMNVTDAVGYQKYRDGMTPLLHAVGGKFSYDFEIARTLANVSDHPVTRVFEISFPDRETSARFSADPEYKKIRTQFWAPSVDGYTTLAEREDES